MSLMKKTILIIIFFFFILTSISYSERGKAKQAFFKGKIIEISDNFVTIERARIVIPKKVKTINHQGSPVSLGEIKKGDYIILIIEKDEAIIQKVSENQKDIREELIPQ